MNESREEPVKGDEAGAGQRPMNRRDVMKTAGLAGVAALASGAFTPTPVAAQTPTTVQAKNPYGGSAQRRDHVAALLPPDPVSQEQQHLLPGPGADRPGRNAHLLHRQHADPGHQITGRHLHHGRARQRQEVLLRFRLRLHAQHHRDGGAVDDGQRHLLHPPARRSLRGPALPLRLRAVDGALEAAARAWAVRPHAQGRHQAHDRRHEDDDPLAHGLVQRLPDRRRLRGRGQRVRFPRRQRRLLQQGRRDHPPLAAVAHQGRRLGLPARLERAFVRLDRRRAARRTLAGTRQGRGRVRHRGATGHRQPPGVEVRHAGHHRHRTRSTRLTARTTRSATCSTRSSRASRWSRT